MAPAPRRGASGPRRGPVRRGARPRPPWPTRTISSPSSRWPCPPVRRCSGWGDPGDAVDRLTDLLGQTLDNDTARVAGPGFATLARAVADLQRLQPREGTTGQLRVLRQSADTDPLGPGPVPATRPGCTAQWECELARATDDDTLEQWSRAATEWDRLTRPHDAAYCRWRAAQVALREGGRPSPDGSSSAPLPTRASTSRYTGRSAPPSQVDADRPARGTWSSCAGPRALVLVLHLRRREPPGPVARPRRTPPRSPPGADPSAPDAGPDGVDRPATAGSSGGRSAADRRRRCSSATGS